MIKSLHKAFDLLEYLSSAGDRTVPLSELASAIGEKTTTCANILKTMTERGYVTRFEKKGYRLGGAAYRLVDREPPEDEELIRVSSGPMNDLSNDLDVSTVLAVLRDGRKRVLFSESAKGVIQVGKSYLDNDKLLTTPTGLVLLSAKPDDYIKKLVQHSLPSFYNSESEFFDKINEIRSTGGIMLNAYPEVSDAAVGIYKGNTLIASLGAYFPAYRHSEEFGERLFAKLRKAAKEIEQNLHIK
jgi:DNA-binding IclR family transcriptional regulator